MSKIVFLADLTVLRLISYCIEQKYHKTHISANFMRKYLQLVFLAEFDRFIAHYYCMSKTVTKLISPRVLCTSISNRFPSWFDRFTACYNCMSKNVTKLISPRVLCTSVTISFSYLTWPFYGSCYNCLQQKYHKTHISFEFYAQLSQNRVFSWFDRFTLLVTTVWAEISQNSYLREFCA